METNNYEKKQKICREITENTIAFISGELKLNCCDLRNSDVAEITHNIVISICTFFIAQNSRFTDFSPSQLYEVLDIESEILDCIKEYDRQWEECRRKI